MDAVDIRHEEICCDRLRLNQVLLNLLSNAIKYTPVGGMVSLRIQEKAGAPAGFANYEFHIKDTGIGIPAEHQSRIFERFFRVDKSRSKASGGTGLGLSIVKHIAQYHGATIKLQSEFGCGTTVSVVFPL